MPQNHCDACYNQSATECCSQCLEAYYCNDQCAAQAWPQHHLICAGGLALIPSTPAALNSRLTRLLALFAAPEILELAAAQTPAERAAGQRLTLRGAIAHLQNINAAAVDVPSHTLMQRILNELHELEVSIGLLMGLDAVSFGALASLQHPAERWLVPLLPVPFELELRIAGPQGGGVRSFSFAMLFQVFLLLLRLVFMAGNFLQAEDMAIRFLYGMRTVGFFLSAQQLVPTVLQPLRLGRADPEEVELHALVQLYAGVQRGTATKDAFRSALTLLWSARFGDDGRTLKEQLADALLEEKPRRAAIDPPLRALAKLYKQRSQLNSRTITAVLKTFFYQLIALQAARAQGQEAQLLILLTQRLVPSVVRRLNSRSLETDEPLLAIETHV